MMQVVANSGILFDDALDRLRGNAIIACQDGLPKPMVEYLQAMESRYLDWLYRQHKNSMAETGWKVEGSVPARRAPGPPEVQLARDDLMALMRAFPQAAPVIGDLIAKNLNAMPAASSNQEAVQFAQGTKTNADVGEGG